MRARIQLNVPLTTLMGLSQRPGELGGFGPILTEVARQLTLNQLTNPDALSMAMRKSPVVASFRSPLVAR
ncbi:hypothetical protein HEB94_006258 [Actinopolymorpha pittospori]|uniref:Uncharacterized protein n=1 Tax=Actinopolymorpha pittospori TaxID=648752 RepID=A0A927MYQ6_9ACTN|nr:hypothetical protein [Actinopolymorpha pittospori]